MPRYTIFGLAIDSTIPLPEMSPGEECPADVFIRFGDIERHSENTQPNEEYVRVGAVAEFLIRGGREITVRPGAKANDELVRVLLCGRIMAFLMRQRGWLSLHASAVDMGSEAILFLGPVGAGKSTTAAAFHSAGYPLLSDDVCPVRVSGGRATLCCGPPRLRLCADAAQTFQHLDPNRTLLFDKFAFRVASRIKDQVQTVRRIYLLADGTRNELQPLSPVDAFRVIGKESFLELKRAGSEVRAAHLRDCAGVVTVARPVRLIRPRGFSHLASLIQLVERDIQNDPPLD